MGCSPERNDIYKERNQGENLFSGTVLRLGNQNVRLQLANFEIDLSDEWTEVCGRTEKLSLLYAQIYEDGPVRYEIEGFNDSGDCRIRRYYR